MRHEPRRTNPALMATAMALVAGIATPATAGAETSGGAAERGGAEPPRITVTEIDAPAGTTLAVDDWSEISDRGHIMLEAIATGGERSLAVWHRGVTDALWPAPRPYDADFEVDMSDRGHVVGLTAVPGCEVSPATLNCRRPVLWDRGETRSLPVDTPVFGAVMRVSDRGLAVAQLRRADPTAPFNTTREVVAWRDREVVQGPTALSIIPLAVNEAGQVALTFMHPPNQGYLGCAAIWQVGGALTPIGPCTGPGTVRVPADINRRGDVVGLAASPAGPVAGFVWQDGQLTNLPGALVDLNDAGDAVGLTYPTWHAALWRNGTTIDLGTLGGARSQAVAVDEHGQVVGWSETADGEQHAFLWEDGRLVDLGALAGAESSSRAVDINDRGQILGEVDGRPVVWTVHGR
jgi:probable HAF family extracellular repeat protein